MATARTRPRQPPSPSPEYPDHLGFILAEEDALKSFLENAITLPNNTGVEEKLRVWYRYPSAEHATTFPFITLDLVGVEAAYDLWHSDYTIHPDSEKAEDTVTGDLVEWRAYDPSTSPKIDPDQWPGLKFERRNYLPYRLYYQVGLWTKSAVHDRLLTARLLRDVILPRPFWLLVPADQVWRRMEVLEWTGADIATQDGADKRIFRKIVTLSIQTDIPQDKLAGLDLQPYIQKLLFRMQETTSGGWVSGSEDTPPEVTTNTPIEWWEIYAERPQVNP